MASSHTVTGTSAVRPSVAPKALFFDSLYHKGTKNTRAFDKKQRPPGRIQASVPRDEKPKANSDFNEKGTTQTSCAMPKDA